MKSLVSCKYDVAIVTYFASVYSCKGDVRRQKRVANLLLKRAEKLRHGY